MWWPSSFGTVSYRSVGYYLIYLQARVLKECKLCQQSESWVRVESWFLPYRIIEERSSFKFKFYQLPYIKHYRTSRAKWRLKMHCIVIFFSCPTGTELGLLLVKGAWHLNSKTQLWKTWLKDDVVNDLLTLMIENLFQRSTFNVQRSSS